VPDYRLTEAQIEAAVGWWSGKLRGPVKHSMMTDEARRDPANRPAVLAEVTAGMRRPQISEGQILLFSENLRAALQAVDHARWFMFGVDYDPEIILQDALDAAEIRHWATLPWKTWMSFEGGGVQVSEGYGAPRVDVLPAEASNEP
jgi:hypothetical protein